MTKTTRYCDECGKPQGEGNHWFRVARLMVNGLVTVSITTDPTGPEDEDDACGEECALKLASKLLRGVEVAA